MSTPRVSIVLPVHNGSRYLSEAIESIRAQTDRAWELIIVDDASTDNTSAIAAAACQADERIGALRHDRNRRLPGALNTGLRAARGEYLTWTSDDNLYEPNAVKTLVRVLDERADADIVYSDYTVINAEGGEVTRQAVGAVEDLADRNCIGACFLFRRSVYKALGGYDESLFLVEDYDFWLRAARRFRFVPLHEDLYRYRRHAASLTDQRRDEIARDTDRLLERRIAGLRSIPRERRAAALIAVAERHRCRGDQRAVRRVFWKALACAPRAVWRDERSVPLAAIVAGYRIASLFNRLRRKNAGVYEA